MRILALYYTHKPGGFCKRLYRLLNACAERGMDVHYVTLDPPPMSLSGHVRTHLIPFPMRRRSGLFFWTLFILWCPLYVAMIAARLKPTKYVVFGAFYSAMLTFAKITHQAPVVLFLRSLVFKINAMNHVAPGAQFVSDALDRRGIANASLVVCMTETMKKELVAFLGYEPPRMLVLPNDIPSPINNDMVNAAPAMLSSVPSTALLVLAAGVLDQRKNIGFAITVFALLASQKTTTPLHLCIAGDGPLLDQYRDYVVGHGLKNVTFLGWCPSLAPILSRTNLVLHPSLHEGMSNSILEALAVNVPVIAARSAENRDLLGSDKLLFDTDDPATLAAFLAHIDQAKLGELKSLCQSVVQRLSFDWDGQATGIVEAA